MFWRSILLFLSAAYFASAQDCAVSFSLTAAGASANLDNRTKACTTWTIAYTSSGFSAVTLTFQSAPDSSGAPGTFVTFAGTVNVGVNPNVATTNAYTTLTGFYPWLRANLAVTGSGTLRGIFYGWRTGAARGGAPVVPGCTPAGSEGSVQYYTGGACGGDANFLYTPTALSTPSAPALATSGTPGATTYGYKVAAVDSVGTTLASSETTIATGNATLTGTNKIVVTTAAVSGATSCDVYRTTSNGTPATVGRIGSVSCGSAFSDTGLAPNPPDYYVPWLTPPTNTTQGVSVAKNLTVSGLASLGTFSWRSTLLGQYYGIIGGVDDTFSIASAAATGAQIGAVAESGSTSDAGTVLSAMGLWTDSKNAGNYAQLHALTASTSVSGASGTVTDMDGVVSIPLLKSAANVTNQRAFRAIGGNLGSGTITNAYGYYVDLIQNAGGGTITNVYGMYIASQSTGTNNYGLYVAGSTVRSVFEGSIQVTGGVSSAALSGAGTAPTVGTCGTIGTGSKNNAGFVTSGTTGTCGPVLTFSVAATTGWSCHMDNSTTTANVMQQTASSTTTATFTGTTANGDVLRYSCMAY